MRSMRLFIEKWKMDIHFDNLCDELLCEGGIMKGIYG